MISRNLGSNSGGDRSIVKMCMNLVLTGSPGTGKTTFARLLFRFMYAYGICTKDEFVERNGLELKSDHVLSLIHI